jgi:MoxR-like ATPase
MEKPESVITKEEINFNQDLVRKIPVADNVVDYAVKIVSATRPAKNGKYPYINEWIRWGAGPRASQYLVLAAKVRASLQGRITPDIADIKAMALPVLRHRIVISYNAEAENVNVSDIIDKLISDLA